MTSIEFDYSFCVHELTNKNIRQSISQVKTRVIVVYKTGNYAMSQPCSSHVPATERQRTSNIPATCRQCPDGSVSFDHEVEDKKA